MPFSQGARVTPSILVTDGNRYLLLWALDNYDAEAPAAARWLIDQMVGMPISRRGDYNGLMTPPPVPYGEAGDELVDALDVHAAVRHPRAARGPHGSGGFAGSLFTAALLMSAMASVLSTMTPANWEPWRNVLAAIDREVTDAALNQWVVDLAFADELTPTDPNLALSELAGSCRRGSRRRTGGPHRRAWRADRRSEVRGQFRSRGGHGRCGHRRLGR